MDLPIENSDYLLVIKHGWLENRPLICDFPIETSIDKGFSIAMFDYQRVDTQKNNWIAFD